MVQGIELLPASRHSFVQRNDETRIFGRRGEITVFGGVRVVVVQLCRHNFVGASVLPFNESIAVRLHGVAHDFTAWVLTEDGILQGVSGASIGVLR